jgi:spermidine/putrescine transport system substrate-binding protein
VAAQLAAWVNYICPVQGAKEAMEKIDPELAANKLIFPDERTLSNAKNFMGLDQKTEQRYQKQFAAVVGA